MAAMLATKLEQQTKVTGHGWPQHAMGLEPSPNIRYYTDKEKQYVPIYLNPG